MTRILFVVYSLDTGGLERMVVELANALDPGVYLPSICCIAAAGELAAAFSHQDRLFVIGHRGRIDFWSCARVHRIIKRERIDIVHSHNAAGLLYAFFSAKLRGVPVIHTNHGFAPPDSESTLLGLAERWMTARVKRYVCVSETLKRTVVARWGLEADTVAVVYNGVRTARSNSANPLRGSKEIVIGSVGRLNPIKNYPLLLESFSEIVRTHPRCRLELIGEGPERGRLITMIDNLSLRGKVTLRGEVRDVLEALKPIDIFVLPSLSEGLSMSILEAMSLGKACVVSNVGGNPEIVTDRANGFLFESNDGRALTEALTAVIRDIDTPEMDRVRRAAYETARDRFSFDEMVKRYAALYDEATRGGGAA
jgi:glycosyltransferase involved in cell wall biosynthesis